MNESSSTLRYFFTDRINSREKKKASTDLVGNPVSRPVGVPHVEYVEISMITNDMLLIIHCFTRPIVSFTHVIVTLGSLSYF